VREGKGDRYREGERECVCAMTAAAAPVAGANHRRDNKQAKTIARYALEVSRGAVRGVVDTPFSRQATEEMNMIFRGGKLDDITVVVAKVYGPAAGAAAAAAAAAAVREAKYMHGGDEASAAKRNR
jgi:hypothetical protein